MNSPPAHRTHRPRPLKTLLDMLSLVLAAPMAGLFRLEVYLAPRRKDTSYQGFTQLLSLIPGLPGVFLRRAFARLTLLACGRDCHIGFGTVFASPDVAIQERVYIGVSCNIGHADIGDDVLIGSHVTILSGTRQHHFDRMDIPINQQGGQYQPVSIGEDVWIGNGAIVATDVGPHAIVGAGAVVTRPVAAATIVAGNPASPVGHRSPRGSEVDGAPEVT